MANLGRIDPRTLPGLFAWYDASYVNGFGQAQPADGAALAQWNDLSGNGRHLVQGTGANQPLFRLTGGPDNRPSVNFVDATDTMQAPTAGGALRPITVIAVFKNTVADDGAVHRPVNFNASRIGVALDWLTANAFTGWDDAAVTATSGVAGDTTTYHVTSFLAQPVGPRSICSVDGIHTDFAGQAGTNSNLNVDIAVPGFIGHVVEALVFTGELSKPIMFALEQALAEKWSLLTTYQLQK